MTEEEVNGRVPKRVTAEMSKMRWRYGSKLG